MTRVIGISRRARTRTCHGCHAEVITGFDDEDGGYPEIADPQPLNELGEAVAILEGRHTATLNPYRDGRAINRRPTDSIRRRPAGRTTFEDVLREHVCNTPPVPPPLRAPSRLNPKPTTRTGSIPPF